MGKSKSRFDLNRQDLISNIQFGLDFIWIFRDLRF